jgi:hypothetical protein
MIKQCVLWTRRLLFLEGSRKAYLCFQRDKEMQFIRGSNLEPFERVVGKLLFIAIVKSQEEEMEIDKAICFPDSRKT